LAVAKAVFDAMLRDGTARRAEGPWSSALHLVPKKDSGWWPCRYYRALNARTIPDRYPVPHIQDYSHRLSGCTTFSILDLSRITKNSYSNRRHPKDSNYHTLWPFRISLYVLWSTKTRPTFHHFMDCILKDLDFCFAYTDDILLFRRSPEEHDQHFRTPFKQLKRYAILLNPFKYVFRVSEISFLGYKISSMGSQPLPDRVAELQPCPLPSPVANSDVSWEC
jgi:hypothetical protein